MSEGVTCWIDHHLPNIGLSGVGSLPFLYQDFLKLRRQKFVSQVKRPIP